MEPIKKIREYHKAIKLHSIMNKNSLPWSGAPFEVIDGMSIASIDITHEIVSKKTIPKTMEEWINEALTRLSKKEKGQSLVSTY